MSLENEQHLSRGGNSLETLLMLGLVVGLPLLINGVIEHDLSFIVLGIILGPVQVAHAFWRHARRPCSSSTAPEPASD